MEGFVHVCIKLKRGLPSLRQKDVHELFLEKFRLIKERFDCKLRQFSIQHDHIHLLIETKKTSNLSRYMQGLQIRFAKSLNRLWKRRGKVFADRFFARLCRNYRETRAAIRYILNNALRHGVLLPKVNEPDPYSSGPWYFRWGQRAWSRFKDPQALWPIAHPRDTPQYEIHPFIEPDEVPGHGVRARYALA